MTDTGVSVPSEGNLPTTKTGEDVVQGWYFYGITRSGPLPAVLTGADGVQTLECSGLAAVVRTVPLHDFSGAALQDRLQNATELEAMVRSHNRVIEAVHAQQAILPAKFGLVHAQAEDVVSALRRAHDQLLRQLEHLEGCDEWAVHIYADRAVIERQISGTDPALARLRDEYAAARPGRAYFLEQQFRDELEVATEQALSALGQAAFDRLERCAVSGQVNPVRPATDLAGEEILRASFLVTRNDAAHFKEQLLPNDLEGLRCEYSGPWPPYSFAIEEKEEEA